MVFIFVGLALQRSSKGDGIADADVGVHRFKELSASSHHPHNILFCDLSKNLHHDLICPIPFCIPRELQPDIRKCILTIQGPGIKVQSKREIFLLGRCDPYAIHCIHKAWNRIHTDHHIIGKVQFQEAIHRTHRQKSF